MKILIQKVSSAEVEVESKIVGKINTGFLIFMGVEEDDSLEDLSYIVRKVIGLRIFEDSAGKMNLNLEQVNGSLLLVSQFTLLADTRKGNRPSFNKAANPTKGNEYYHLAIDAFRRHNYKVETGVFGAQMKIGLTNEGPVTIWIDSKDRFRSKN